MKAFNNGRAFLNHPLTCGVAEPLLSRTGISARHCREMNKACDDFWRARGIEPRNFDWKNNRILIGKENEK
jgi:hypothetical protein